MNDTLEQVRLTEWASGAGCAAKMCSRDLSEVLALLPKGRDPNLLVGLETSDDAGVYRIRDNLALVDTADFFPPMVDDPFSFGQIAAANALSDVYAMGAKPITALNLVAFPIDELGGDVLQEILRGGLSKLDEAGVALAGGHSIIDKEVKYGLSVTGLIDPARIITNAGARVGNSLLLTKPLGVGIINTSIKRGCGDPATVARATASMTQLNRRAGELMLEFDIHACTDVTGFGLLGHAVEMARASDVSLELDSAAILSIPGALELCADGIKPGGLANNRRSFSEAVKMSPGIPAPLQDLLFDPQTSGGLLMALPESAASELQQRLSEVQETDAFVIGRAVSREKNGPEILVG